MRVLVVDDEAPARARLSRMIEDLPGYRVVAEAGDGVSALAAAQDAEPDIILLDVRMPRMDGLELARHLADADLPPAVIFTTAFDEYALAAFDANAVAYLLKPVRAERLHDALQRAARPTRAQMEVIGKQRQHISARIGGRLVVLPIAAVYSLIADQKYVCARHDDGELVVDATLKDLEREFGDRFMRVHRRALVAVDQVERLETRDNGSGVVHLRDGSTSEVSRRHLGDVKRRLRGA